MPRRTGVRLTWRSGPLRARFQAKMPVNCNKISKFALIRGCFVKICAFYSRIFVSNGHKFVSKRLKKT